MPSLSCAFILGEQHFPGNTDYIQVFKNYSEILPYILMV